MFHIPAVLCLSPLVFLGCSFAQPSGLAPLSLCLDQGTPKPILYTRRFTHICFVSLVPTLTFRIYGGSSIAATPPLRSSKTMVCYRYNYLRDLGEFDCRFRKKHLLQKKINKEKVKVWLPNSKFKPYGFFEKISTLLFFNSIIDLDT
jgi:hypothetical protein